MVNERFVADTMLGKLAKWLRVMGMDVVYDRHAADDQLLRLAEQEGRTLLTRDHRLVGRHGPARRLLIKSDYYHEQVRQVAQVFGLHQKMHVFSRCLRCNMPLRILAKEAVAARVPPYVYATQMTFKHCAACDRLYWGGTHRDNMLRQLRVMLGETPASCAEVAR